MNTIAEIKEYAKNNINKIGNDLKEIYNLIEQKVSKETIQVKYKLLKDWLKNEYVEYQKDRYFNTYIAQWYFPLVQDIYVSSFREAKSNSSIKLIQDAVIDGESYFNTWNAMFQEYQRNNQ